MKRVLVLIALSYVFFFFGNNFLSLTDPDEVFYSLTAKEMAAHGEWMTPYIFDQPQFEKPVFTYWLLRVAFEFGGTNPFSARFFPALFACLGVLGVYALGLLGFKDERKAFWSGVVLCTGALYVGLGKTVFTDMVFSVFILYSFLAFFLAYADPRRKALGLVGFYVFAGLAVLTKGPLGLLIPQAGVILFLLYRRQLNFLYDRWTAVGLLVGAAIALPWYTAMFNKYGQDFIQEFFYNDHWRRLFQAEHKGNDRWFFYPMTMLMGTFPWTLFLGAACVALYKKLKWGLDGFEYFILSWVIAVFAAFQPAHSKLTSYILPLFPALALLTGGFIDDALASRSRVVRVSIFTVAAFMLILGIGVLFAQPLYQKYLPSSMPVYFLSALLVTMAGGMVMFVLKEKPAPALGMLSLALLPFLLTAFMIKGDLEPYVSTMTVSQYVPHYPGQKTTLLSSKPYARGLRYYTGQDITVLDINGGNYFSPHPITILTTTGQLTDFLQRQKLTYAVLKKGGYKAVSNLPSDRFKVSLLKAVGYNYVLKIESLPAS